MIDIQLTTKRDLEDMRLTMKTDMLKMQLEIGNKLTVRMGAMFTVNIVIMGVMLKFFN